MDERDADPASNHGLRGASLIETRRRLMHDVLARQRGLETVGDDLLLDLEPRDGWDQTLGELNGAWPHACFELMPDDGAGPVRLRITGPAGVGEEFRTALEAGPAAFRRRSRTAATLRWRWRVLTSRLRVLPDFIIIGTSKGGTTSLFYYLRQHPCVVPPSQKELFFFDRDYAKGISRYRAYFPTVFKRMRHRRDGRAFLTGEASPTYLDHPEVPRRARRFVPDAKLIVILRDPVERAYSLYELKRRSREEQLSFDEAIAREARELEDERMRVAADDRYFSRLLHHHSYLSGGMYADHLDRWNEVFPRDQLLVLHSRDLYQRRTETYGRVLEFLGLPEDTPQQFDTLNKVPYHSMDAATNARLREYFRPHNERLWERLGVNYGWNDKPSVKTPARQRLAPEKVMDS